MNQIHPDSILKGPFSPGKVRVISVKLIGDSQVKIEAIGFIGGNI